MLPPLPERAIVDSGYYAACAGLRARTQALELISNNLANLNTAGYSSSQVDKRKVGKLATAIQVAFQQMGVLPGGDGANVGSPLSNGAIEVIEHAEREAAIHGLSTGPAAASESGDLSSLRQELEDVLATEIQRKEVAVTVGPDGLVVSLREIGFFDSGSATKRDASLAAFSRIAWLLLERPYRIRIEGHTDNRPIHNSEFKDNWGPPRRGPPNLYVF
jgi:chemotaxis protein MotB